MFSNEEWEKDDDVREAELAERCGAIDLARSSTSLTLH